MNLRGRTAVITGAANGIGRALAQKLTARGCPLALIDVDAVGLKETRTLLGDAGVDVSLHELDVCDAGAVAALPRVLARSHPRIDLLINNAGVAVGGLFEEVSQADFEWLFAVNFWGTVRMTRAFLPLLRQSDAGRIVNLSSMFGLVSPPGQSAYSASKFAVRGFSDALRNELEGSTVAVTVVYPGGVATRIARNARKPAGRSPQEIEREIGRIEKALRMPPESAAEVIVRGIERGKSRVLVGTDVRLGSLLARLMPASHWRLLRHALRL